MHPEKIQLDKIQYGPLTALFTLTCLMFDKLCYHDYSIIFYFIFIDSQTNTMKQNVRFQGNK